MDSVLAEAIVRLQIPHFGKSFKNKSDCSSCLFQPRRLLSDPNVLSHIGKEMARVVIQKCQPRTIVGLATSGIAFATSTSMMAHMMGESIHMMYVRKEIERGVSDSLIEGILPHNKEVILVDDLIFAGESKNAAIEVLFKLGYKVTDIIVAIDRQLQRKKDGVPIEEKWGLTLHSLINMDQIVQYMSSQNKITRNQLDLLREDYQKFDRWHMPEFAK